MPTAYMQPQTGDYGAGLFVRADLKDEAHLAVRELLGEERKKFTNAGVSWSVYELNFASPVAPSRGRDLRPQTVIRWLQERGWTILPYSGQTGLL